MNRRHSAAPTPGAAPQRPRRYRYDVVARDTPGGELRPFATCMSPSDAARVVTFAVPGVAYARAQRHDDGAAYYERHAPRAAAPSPHTGTPDALASVRLS